MQGRFRGAGGRLEVALFYFMRYELNYEEYRFKFCRMENKK